MVVSNCSAKGFYLHGAQFAFVIIIIAPDWFCVQKIPVMDMILCYLSDMKCIYIYIYIYLTYIV